MPVSCTELPLRPLQFTQGRFELGVARLQVGGGPVRFTIGLLGTFEQELPALVQRRILQGHSGLTGQDGQHRAIGRIEGAMLRGSTPRSPPGDTATEHDRHERMMTVDDRVAFDGAGPDVVEAAHHLLGKRWPPSTLSTRNGGGVGSEHEAPGPASGSMPSVSANTTQRH